MTIKIEKGIPIPKRYNKYPWKELKIGDSFYVEGLTSSSGVQTSARRFNIRLLARKERNGVRFWRIK